MGQVLVALIIWDSFRLILFNFVFSSDVFAAQSSYIVTQIVAWLILLRGLETGVLPLLIGGGVGLVLGLLFPEPAGEILSWGFLPAVPLTAVAYVRSRPVPVPIIPPILSATFSNTRRPIGTISREMIESQRPILECITDGVIFINNEGTIEYANQTAAANVGVGVEELVGRPTAEVLARLPLPSGSSNGERAAGSTQFEMNGRVLQNQMNLVYDEAGAVQGTVAILRDISAEYQAERAKSAFLTTISHELRTPLTAIKGYVELMQSGTGGEINPNQKIFLSTIQRNADRMVQLINSLIFASSAKGGRVDYKAGHADLRQLINQIVRELEYMASENEQRMTVEVDSRLPPIQADPIHISTILQELIANSVKYNRPSGEIRIAAFLESEMDPGQKFALVSVSDEGIGIDLDDQSHVFEDFFRPDRLSRQVRAGGIGMGLSIVRALVEAYNGRIWFESSPGEGTVFTFIIPINQPVEARQLWPPDDLKAHT
ncbi:MAG: ATP-binding protein [Candidatus Promineifilaceae bacterium]